MKKGLRSRIRALRCPQVDSEQATGFDRELFQRRYAEGFDLAARLVLEYMDTYAPLPEMLFSHVEELQAKRVDDIHGDGRPCTVISNAGFILACDGILKLVYDEHGDQIGWARAIERAEEGESPVPTCSKLREIP